jgi:5-formyltetrahydrofolate cyclo-ligase
MNLTKADLRRDVQAKLKELPPATAALGSARLVARVTELPEWRESNSVLLFLPLAGEPALEVLLELALAGGKTVAMPAYEPGSETYVAREVRMSETDLVRGRYGVREPHEGCPLMPVGALDFAVVPGVAFMSDGKRLGRGRGFYDRLLSSFRGVSCGVGFDEQIVPEIPVEPHDVELSYVATPTRLWDCRSAPMEKRNAD